MEGIGLPEGPTELAGGRLAGQKGGLLLLMASGLLLLLWAQSGESEVLPGRMSSRL